MSGPSAIAAVTATVRNLLINGLANVPDFADISVTTSPIDKARETGNNANQLNIYLYQTTTNAALRNMNMPGSVRPGETGMPPLALNLYYLITAYGRNDDKERPFSHELLGRAMSILHDHSLLGTDELKHSLLDNDLALQGERVRINLQSLSVEEISKLWSAFQTQHRPSAAYEIAPVLIESARATRTPLPVLTQGPDDTGIRSQSNLIPPFPAIDAIEFPNQQTSGQLGDVLTIKGHHLGGDKVEILFANPNLPQAIIVAAQPGATPDEVKALIDDVPAKWVAGLYGVAVRITAKPGTKDERIRGASEQPFALAPKITSKFPLKVTLATNEATIKLKCSPEVRPAQRVSLLLGDQEVPAEPRTGQTAALAFTVRNAVAGEYLIRLRVDGVDSQLVDRSTTPPKFQDHRVVIA